MEEVNGEDKTACTIAVSRLDNEVTREELLTFFSYCGEVANVMSYPDPLNAGYKRAIITFADPAGAEMGFLLDGAELHGSALVVAPVSIKESGITVGELGQKFQTFMGRESAGKTLKKNGEDDKSGLAKRAAKYKKQVQKLDNEHKVALWAGAALVGAACVWGAKYVSNQQKREQERKTRYLVGAYDHLFRHGPGNNRGY